jgi:hypothetical protein
MWYAADPPEWDHYPPIIDEFSDKYGDMIGDIPDDLLNVLWPQLEFKDNDFTIYGDLCRDFVKQRDAENFSDYSIADILAWGSDLNKDGTGNDAYFELMRKKIVLDHELVIGYFEHKGYALHPE